MRRVHALRREEAPHRLDHRRRTAQIDVAVAIVEMFVRKMRGDLIPSAGARYPGRPARRRQPDPLLKSVRSGIAANRMEKAPADAGALQINRAL